jgi:RNA polymerase sigma-70 factor (ECF subfamily)
MTVREFDTPRPLAVLRAADASPSTRPRRENASAGANAAARRLRCIIDRHYDFVWRTIRHLGVPEANAEDATQQVLCVLARRVNEIVPGAEMSFLFSTAMRVASEARRAARRHPEAALRDIATLKAAIPTPEQLLDERRAHEVLRKVLDAIPIDLRIVFVLYEIEELNMAEVAALVGIPAGTAASRLRRARESFRSIVRRIRTSQNHGPHGGRP